MVFEESYGRVGADGENETPNEYSHWFNDQSLEELNRHINMATHHLHTPLEALAVGTRPLFLLGVMCSSRLNEQNSPEKVEAIRECISRLCRDNVIDGVITGGGPGLMKAVMQTAKSHGKLTIAVKLPFENEKHLEQEDDYTDVAVITHEFGFRNAVFLALANHYLYLWGGWGTMMEASTQLQARQMAYRDFDTRVYQLPRTANALAFLPRFSLVGPMYRPLMDMSDMMVAVGTIKPAERLVMGLPSDQEADDAFGRVLFDEHEAYRHILRSRKDWEQTLAMFYQQYPELQAEDKAVTQALKEWP